MVYGFIKQSGGSINVHSALGHGTTVKLYLPKTDASADSREENGGQEEMPRGQETILLVEDDEDVRSTVAMLLRDLGYTVLEAENGEVALEILKHEHETALLLTDVVMPGIGGYDLAKEFQRLRPDIKVLYTSGYTENGMKEKLKGATLLSKPYQEEDLARKVRALLDA